MSEYIANKTKTSLWFFFGTARNEEDSNRTARFLVRGQKSFDVVI